MPPGRKRQTADKGGEDAQVTKKPRGDTTGAAKGLAQGTDAEGNPYWEIGSNRRVSSSQYRGATLVNIREYYTAPDGELRPGKKGISLTLEQYKALLKVIPALNEELRAQGHAVDNPPAAGTSSETSGKTPAASEKSEKRNVDQTSEESGEEVE